MMQGDTGKKQRRGGGGAQHLSRTSLIGSGRTAPKESGGTGGR